MCNDALLIRLRNWLHDDIAEFEVRADGSGAARAGRRLRNVAEHSPAFLALLAEPWLEAPDTALADTLLHCARIHLYARVLDDALDENLPHDRQHLLRAQPLLWRSAFVLGSRYPAQLEASSSLIADTVRAVWLDDRSPAPAHWGTKNHHLLLAPLLLSGGDAAYLAAESGLSNLIAISQALEEVEQGAMFKENLVSSILVSLPEWLNADSVLALQRHGWHRAAQRLVRDGRILLEKIQVL